VAKSARQGRENRLMGYHKGFPDLFIAVSANSYNGLMIELKVKNGKVQPEQEATIAKLIDNGYKAVICRSAEEAIIIIDSYLKQATKPRMPRI
jgi:hypothetical protein